LGLPFWEDLPLDLLLRFLAQRSSNYFALIGTALALVEGAATIPNFSRSVSKYKG